jgi:hypothetical protein
MALLFDTSAFPAGERDDALTDFFSAAGVPIRATHREQANYSVHHYWKFGTNDLFLARGAGLRLVRGPSEVLVAAPKRSASDTRSTAGTSSPRAATMSPGAPAT